MLRALHPLLHSDIILHLYVRTLMETGSCNQNSPPHLQSHYCMLPVPSDMAFNSESINKFFMLQISKDTINKA